MQLACDRVALAAGWDGTPVDIEREPSDDLSAHRLWIGVPAHGGHSEITAVGDQRAGRPPVAPDRERQRTCWPTGCVPARPARIPQESLKEPVLASSD